MVRGRKTYRPRVTQVTGDSSNRRRDKPDGRLPVKRAEREKELAARRAARQKARDKQKAQARAARDGHLPPMVGMERRQTDMSSTFRATCTCGWRSSWLESTALVARAQTEHRNVHENRVDPTT